MEAKPQRVKAVHYRGPAACAAATSRPGALSTYKAEDVTCRNCLTKTPREKELKP